eukprot:9141884-Prorocentrum_lima.AAC.1
MGGCGVCGAVMPSRVEVLHACLRRRAVPCSTCSSALGVAMLKWETGEPLCRPLRSEAAWGQLLGLLL